MDPVSQFKEKQKSAWSTFSVLENITGTVSPRLVSFAGITAGATVLDAGCGSGVAGLTAARLGAKVTGIDIAPALIERAKENAALVGVEAIWREGDIEALPDPDATYDFVLSQFGHMFTHRPHLAVSELLRVLKPGGVFAFTTWPPESYTGRLFTLMGQFYPSQGMSCQVNWGEPPFVREQLGAAVKNITFSRGAMSSPAISVKHHRLWMERNFAPATQLFGGLDANAPAKGVELRRALDDLSTEFFENNTMRQDYLITRAVKV